MLATLAPGGEATEAARGDNARRCRIKTGYRLAEDRVAVVYAEHNTREGRQPMYVCAFAQGKLHQLDSPVSSLTGFRGRAVALAGTVVGFAIAVGPPGQIEDEPYPGERTRIEAFDALREKGGGRSPDHRRTHTIRAAPTAVASLVVTRRRSLAWTECPARYGFTDGKVGSDCLRPGRLTRVARYDYRAKRPRILDTGRGIDPSSLRLSGSTLSWTNGGQVKTATLP